ncbi:HD domain-containing phosphohydrolase [Thalassotalea sediminis]|uniref:HD domain-containing phosphohydrolase n=1 Tax=Thalassotalea sediminis TaxID=1759089 RepID=UPI002572B26E|nr:HD domain-containing phosphohydrolase [Thalassotalea sediminis]
MALSFLSHAKPNELMPWRVLIVDDEEDIHHVTKMALKRFELDGRKLSFLHAYSAAEAQKILEKEQNIALIFLDVVMETDDAGLTLTKWIRKTLKNKFSRIVLRTGQPGQAPEEQVIVEFDINDYKEKTELDRKKLFTTVFSALRAYRDIIEVDKARIYQELYRTGLERVIESTGNVLEQRSLTEFFSGLLQQIMSLLQIEQESMLLQVKGLGAIYSENDFQVLAQISGNNVDKELKKQAFKYLNLAIEEKCSIFQDDVLVGYFPSNTEKVSLLYLKGINALTEIDAKLLEIFSGNVSLAFDNLLLNREIVETQEELIYRLGDVVESRSNEAGNHIRRMAEVSFMLAIKLGMDEEQAELLKQAAPMHDIGKISTPDRILLKPGKLTESEMEEMKRHPVIGENILHGSTRPILQAAAIIAAQHHEKYDGTGYPKGLVAEEIHIFARIVAVADVFDALTHKRCYKEAWPMDKVQTFLHEAAGTHLDPKIVSIMLDNIALAEDINQQYQDI